MWGFVCLEFGSLVSREAVPHVFGNASTGSDSVLTSNRRGVIELGSEDSISIGS